MIMSFIQSEFVTNFFFLNIFKISVTNASLFRIIENKYIVSIAVIRYSSNKYTNVHFKLFLKFLTYFFKINEFYYIFLNHIFITINIITITHEK
ncbi:MAG: hypothetical protein RIS64_2325 [Bacteroidota bacterium]|jgi:hypothetical protein